MIAFIGDQRAVHGSSRSARCCRSPHQPIVRMSRSDEIHCIFRRGRDAILRSESRCSACSRPTSGSMVSARSGGSCSVRVRCRPLHGRAADADDGAGGRDPRQGSPELVEGPVRATIGDRSASCPLDRVNREFRAPAPNMLWVPDFTYVATWVGSSTSPSSSIRSPGGSSGGERAGPPMPASFSMRSIKLFTIVDRRAAAVSSITPIAAANTSRSNKVSGLPKPGSSPPSAVSATAMTMLWPRRSTDSTRLS